MKLIKNSTLRNESGFTIIEVLIILSVIGFVAILNVQQSKVDQESADARFIGQQMALYNNAVRSHISVNLDNQDYIDDVTTEFVGVNWLKNADQCGGESDDSFLPCEFPETIGKTNLTYTTTISADLGEGRLRAKTTVDVKTPDGNGTVIGSTQLGLAILTANGGKNSDSLVLSNIDTTAQFDVDGNAATNILLTSTDAQFFYCPFGLDVALLSAECSVDGVAMEDGLIVMISETAGENDSLIRTDGSNTMENTLRFDSAEALQREIVGASAIFNVTGEILKVGNSGVYFDDEWIPVVGDGLVIDTDVLITGSTSLKGDLDLAGDLLANSNIISESAILTGEEIITESDSEVGGDQFILGDANYNNNVNVFGTVDAIIISSQTFAEAKEVSAVNNISSNTIVNAPTVRASFGLFSDGGAITSGDAVTSGDSYVGGNRAVSRVVVTANDLVADQGTSYLGNVFASAIFDPDGDYLIDPSGISRTNITRAETISPSTSGGKIGLNASRILLAREDIGCDSARVECATKVSGYADMENVNIKSPGNGEWIGFVEYLNGLETYVKTQAETIAEPPVIDLPIEPEGWACNGSTMGVKLPRSEALASQRDFGWSCAVQDGFMFEGETAYICTVDCSAPAAPRGSICESPGYLSDTVIVNGADNITTGWSCVLQGESGGTPVYECSIPCRLPDPICFHPDYLVDIGWYSECVEDDGGRFIP